MSKVERALAAAKMLLSAGDPDGACNRAYYAMFDAAHAALYTLGAEDASAPIKTHNGLIAKVGQHLVLTGHLATTHGEAFNMVERLRRLADYSGDPVKLTDATQAVEKAEAFVSAIRAMRRQLDREH